ncbi:hypothetical protein ACWD0A_10035 [Streptomyces sp. NPDC002867]
MVSQVMSRRSRVFSAAASCPVSPGDLLPQPLGGLLYQPLPGLDLAQQGDPDRVVVHARGGRDTAMTRPSASGAMPRLRPGIFLPESSPVVSFSAFTEARMGL